MKSIDTKEKMAEFLRVPTDKLQNETILTDLVHDSFILVEMVIELQESLGIRLHQADLAEVKSVGDLLSVIDSKKK